MVAGNITVDLDFAEDLEAEASEFRDLADEMPGHARAIKRAIGEDLVGGLKRTVGVNTGRLRNTIRVVDTEGGTTRVVAGGRNGVDYVLPYLKGSRPHPPGPSSPDANPGLARWARRNNYPGGFDAIYWSIAKYGTEEHDFVSVPLAETRSDSGDIAAQVLRNRGAFE